MDEAEVRKFGVEDTFDSLLEMLERFEETLTAKKKDEDEPHTSAE